MACQLYWIRVSVFLHKVNAATVSVASVYQRIDQALAFSTFSIRALNSVSFIMIYIYSSRL